MVFKLFKANGQFASKPSWVNEGRNRRQAQVFDRIFKEFRENRNQGVQ